MTPMMTQMTRTLRAIALSLLLASGAGTAFAVETPRALPADARIKVVTYEPNNVVPIAASNLINTQIIFGRTESIINYQSGDSAAWSTNVNQYVRNVLNLKPTILGSKTDLDVITEDVSGKQRFYRFALSSNQASHSVKHAVYAVQFVYPKIAKAKTLAALETHRLQTQSMINASKHRKDYNWAYTFSGNRSLMPRHVFDDGTFTYFQLRPNQPVPAIFAVNNAKGEESVVNVRRIGNTIVVEQLSPEFTLRDGQYQVASVFNTRAINTIQTRG